tara:strand:+ start:28 stop:345 length:318 start_codon:yes stop_codon:yes gene_type:complete
MIKIFTLSIVSILFFSCNSYKPITYSSYIGMKKAEFITVANYSNLTLEHEGVEVYSKKNIKRIFKSGTVLNETLLFYFKNSELVRIDQGKSINPRQVIDLVLNKL